MRTRPLVTRLKPIGFSCLLILTSLACSARQAEAAKIGFVTDGSIGTAGNPSSIQLDRMEAAFYPSESFRLARFVIDRPTSLDPVTYDNVPFTIYYWWVQKDGWPTSEDGTVVFRGHINGTVGLNPAHNALKAIIDSAEVPSSGQVFTAGPDQMFHFPSPSADMKLSAVWDLMTEDDMFSQHSSEHVAPWITVETVPEPAMGRLFAVGIGAVGLWRRSSRRRSRNG